MRTRPNPFQEAWAEVEALITQSPGLQAKTIFEYLLREQPGRFQAGQLRTLQRHLKEWRARKGPDKEVMFAREHRLGELSASNFTHMSTLNVTLCGQAYPHPAYHFVLTYSNWESRPTGGMQRHPGASGTQLPDGKGQGQEGGRESGKTMT